ncbi:MAG TPA: gliding motility-associated C-terminal domain-containing protein, partial [Cytophagales bacterium]|nr:gliding motility-associated C-terminal domain-containing protein [Cytophagales bacterium]
FTADSIKGAGSSPTLEWRVNGVKRSTGRTFATTVLKDKDSVSVYVVSDAVCTFPKSAETNKAGFTVTPLPQPKLQPYILFCREEQDSLVLDASTPGIIQYIWSTLATTPKVAIQEAGDYQVKVIDTNGCTASVQTRVVLSCEPKVSIPSAFTPNGDGKNDELQFFPLYISSFNIQIFNRWGELIFNSDDPQTGWDGTYKGDRVPQGVYNYICTYVGLFKSGGDKRQLRGDVTVLE